MDTKFNVGDAVYCVISSRHIVEGRVSKIVIDKYTLPQYVVKWCREGWEDTFFCSKNYKLRECQLFATETEARELCARMAKDEVKVDR